MASTSQEMKLSLLDPCKGSPSSSSSVGKPFLLLPSGQAPENPGDALCLFSLEDNKVWRNLQNLSSHLGEDAWWVGSTNEWLVLLDQEANPFLFNPFSLARIQLPPWVDTFTKMYGVDKSYFVKVLGKSFITKAILLSDPSSDGDNYQVAVICSSRGLAFYRKGDSTWNFPAQLEPTKELYTDIILCDSLVYALKDCHSVEKWEFDSSFPTKKNALSVSAAATMSETAKAFKGLCFSKTYLVESSGDLLLVMRYVGTYVSQEGEPILEPELGVISPYRTLLFDVYKMDFDLGKLEEVEDLEGKALFLGGNHSVALLTESLPGYERDSIYFTDDNWEDMNDDCLYGGHDLGVYSLQEKTFKPVYDFDSGRIEPSPVWVFRTR